MEHSQHEITDLLRAWANGDKDALEALVPLVLPELRQRARQYMKRERTGHLLQTTALVNEAFIKLVDQSRVDWQNRSHFYAVAALCMRRVLIDYARNRARKRRGEDPQQIEFVESDAGSIKFPEDLLALDLALEKLALQDERKVRVVELHYFCGHSTKEVAGILKVSEATVARDWQLSRAWLFRELSATPSNAQDSS